MTSPSAVPPSAARRGLFRRLFALAPSAEARRREMEHLRGLSNADLARIGLTRDGIARHVFRDLPHL